MMIDKRTYPHPTHATGNDVTKHKRADKFLPLDWEHALSGPVKLVVDCVNEVGRVRGHIAEICTRLELGSPNQSR